MKNLLLLCDAFPPAFAPRVAALCKYIDPEEWQIDVLTEDVTTHGFQSEIPKVQIFRPKYYRTSSKIEWTWKLLLRVCFNHKKRWFLHEAEKRIVQKHYDAIFCSICRDFPLTIAAKLSKEHHIPLVADIRDMVEQYSGIEFMQRVPLTIGKIIAPYVKNKLIAERNKALKEASVVTTVSPWHANILKRINPNTKLIYNGFDPELFFPNHIKSAKFQITYTGRILSNQMQDPTLFFDALTRLVEEAKISTKDFCCRWFVDNDSQQRLQNALVQYPKVADLTEINGFISSHEIPQKLNESSIILVLTNKHTDDGPKGILGTKLYEAMAVERPILCTRSDEGVMTALIAQTKCGISASSADEIYHFILSEYNAWRNGMASTISPDSERISTFSRKKQVAEFAKILQEILR